MRFKNDGPIQIYVAVNNVTADLRAFTNVMLRKSYVGQSVYEWTLLTYVQKPKQK